MNKHTPGPWIAGEKDNSIPRNAELTHIFAVTQERMTQEEKEANVRLAVAAPELLETLENILRLFANCDDDNCNCYERTQMIAEQAIVKAKGE